jgi:hypothetical protein
LLYFTPATLSALLVRESFAPVHIQTERSDDETALFYAVFVANRRLKLAHKSRTPSGTPEPARPNAASGPTGEERAHKLWQRVRRIGAAAETLTWPLGALGDWLGLGAELLVVSRREPRLVGASGP